MGVLTWPRHVEQRTIRQPAWVPIASARGVVEGHRSRSSKVSGTFAAALARIPAKRDGIGGTARSMRAQKAPRRPRGSSIVMTWASRVRPVVHHARASQGRSVKASSAEAMGSAPVASAHAGGHDPPSADGWPQHVNVWTGAPVPTIPRTDDARPSMSRSGGGWSPIRRRMLLLFGISTRSTLCSSACHQDRVSLPHAVCQQ